MEPKEREEIERYLHGQLSPAEAQAFEEAYLGDSELLDEIMLVETLKAGLARHAERRGRPGAARRRFWATPQYAAAASVLLAVAVLGAGTLYLENRSLRDGAAAVTATRLVPLVAVRGRSETELGPFARDEWTVLLVDPGFVEFDTFEAVVARETDGGSDPIWRSLGLTPSYEGLLAVGVPGAELSAGDYRLTVTGRLSDWPASRDSEPAAAFSFRVAAGR